MEQSFSMIKEHSPRLDWTRRRVLIVGAARQGLALAGYLARHGAQILLNDQRQVSELAAAQATMTEWMGGVDHASIRWVGGGHPLSLLDEADLVCVSGGVPLSIPLIIEAIARGIPLSNDSQIFLEAAPCPVVGITGSAGKTTTTTLAGRIADKSGMWRSVWVGGNIGSPLIANLDEMVKDDLAVMELSSFQLEIMDRSPEVAAILNVTPNHLDRHLTMEVYTAAKGRILDFQSASGIAVLGRDDPGAWSLVDHVQGQLLSFGLSELPSEQVGAYYQEGSLFLRPAGQADIKVMDRADIRLRGDHNVLNVLAACAIMEAAGAPVTAMPAGVSDFYGVPHRLEWVRNWGGAAWYNDSIATAPERTMAAIHSFDEPLVLLAGGRDKNLPWDELARLVYQRVDHLIVFGEAAEKINQAMAKAAVEFLDNPERRARPEPLTITHCAKLAEAVTQAAKIAQPGDVVLLSPGGTSFDEFRDFEERGVCFERWVKELP
jgi:UDP-N-acetylmuramoylalanine--D-glutamate ligase